MRHTDLVSFHLQTMQKAANARRTCIDGTVIESDQTDLRVLSKEEGAGKILIWA